MMLLTLASHAEVVTYALAVVTGVACYFRNGVVSEEEGDEDRFTPCVFMLH